MDRRWLAILPGVLILLMPPLLLWPLPVVGGEALVTAPWSEGPAHLWGYWAAQQAGSIEFQSSLLSHPTGQAIHLIDPLHLLPFALGCALGGPALGFNFVLCFGLMVAGLAGYLLARQTGASAEGILLGTCIGLAIPGLLAIGVDGITEGLGAGWVGIQLVALLQVIERPKLRSVSVLGLAGAACAWSGAYNAVWMALVDLPVLVVLCRDSERRSALRSAVLGLGLAVFFALPYLWTAATLKGDRPGSSARAEPMPPDPALPWRGGWREGADGLDLFVPAIFTSDVAGAPTTAYLGIVLLVASALGARRWSRARPWLLGAGAMALLSLGPWWVFGGHRLELGSWAPPALASLFEEVPVVDRISRWYRAGSVAVLLLIPVAVRAGPPRRLLFLAPLVLLDGRFGAPLPLELYRVEMPQDKTIETLEGPIAEIPRASPMFPPEHPEFDPSRVADHNLLLQIRHGQPTSASLNQAPIDADVTGALRTLESQLMSPHPNPYLALSARRQLLAAGYRSILLMPGSMRHPPARFESLIGPMSDGGEDWILFPLTGAVLASEPETGQ